MLKKTRVYDIMWAHSDREVAMKNFSFGNYICELREKKGLTQGELGEKLGVTNKAVSRWENGGAYPSTELMLPLAKELGVTIEDLYKVISEDKSPKTKLRCILEYLMQHAKIITVICSALAGVPYILFVCFSTIEEKRFLTLAPPIILVIVYVMFYFMFVLLRKNPFASAKSLDIYTVIILIAMALGYFSTLRYFIVDFPNGYNLSMGITAVAFMAVTNSLKRRYK